MSTEQHFCSYNVMKFFFLKLFLFDYISLNLSQNIFVFCFIWMAQISNNLWFNNDLQLKYFTHILLKWVFRQFWCFHSFILSYFPFLCFIFNWLFVMKMKCVVISILKSRLVWINKRDKFRYWKTIYKHSIHNVCFKSL